MAVTTRQQPKRQHAKPDEVLPYADVLQTLCLIGARPLVIADLLPSIPERFIRALVAKHNNGFVKKGQGPSELTELFKRSIHRLQTTVIIRLYEDATPIIPDVVERHIHVYREYKRLFSREDAVGKDGFNFNRVWFLLRQHKIGRIGMRLCPTCRCYSAYNREDVADRKNCCSCSLEKYKVQREQEKYKAQRARRDTTSVPSTVSMSSVE